MPSTKKAAKRASKANKHKIPPITTTDTTPNDNVVDDDSDDDDDAADEVEEEEEERVTTNCSFCIRKCTARRCAECGVCVLCSPKCEADYKHCSQGRAACHFHKRLIATDTVDRSQREGVEAVAMGPLVSRVSFGDAISKGCIWMIAYLGLNPEAPLHPASVVGLSVATLHPEYYSVGAKRSLNRRMSSEGMTRPMLNAMLIRLGQLATAQQLVDYAERNPGKQLTAGTPMWPQAFLIGAVTYHPRTKTPMLQLDLVSIAGARLENPSILACSRDANAVCNQVWHCQTLHENIKDGLPTLNIYHKPEPNDIDGVKPLLTNAQVRAALCEPTSASAPAPPKIPMWECGPCS